MLLRFHKGLCEEITRPETKPFQMHLRFLTIRVEAIMNVDLQGNVTPLLEDTESRVGYAIPSPDGSRAAYWKQNISSNVWLLRDF
jgi:hypothetical protein